MYNLNRFHFLVNYTLWKLEEIGTLWEEESRKLFCHLANITPPGLHPKPGAGSSASRVRDSARAPCLLVTGLPCAFRMIQISGKTSGHLPCLPLSRPTSGHTGPLSRSWLRPDPFPPVSDMLWAQGFTNLPPSFFGSPVKHLNLRERPWATAAGWDLPCPAHSPIGSLLLLGCQCSLWSVSHSVNATGQTVPAFAQGHMPRPCTHRRPSGHVCV